MIKKKILISAIINELIIDSVNRFMSFHDAYLNRRLAFRINIVMKYKVILFLVLSGLFFSECIIHKKEKYVFPPNVAEDMRDRITASAEKGRVGYKLYCSDCHGIFAKGKDNVPNFSEKQIDKYSSRYVLRDPTNHAVAIKMNPEDLGDILTYLRYRKTKGPQVPDKPGGL